MSGEQLGRRSLIIDAGYCAVAGSVAIAARRPLARSLGIGPHVVAGAGLGTIAWSVLVAALGRSGDWRRAVSTVATANRRPVR